MNAVILAGGYGTRLRPLTEKTIKPMLPIANIPMLDYTMSHLTQFGIKDFVFTLGYKPEQIIEYAIGYRECVCHFSLENEPLGTLGGVKAAENLLDDIFIVMSGDALENVDLSLMLNKHIESGAMVTMAVTEVDEPSKYGVVKTDAWGIVTDFLEKPKNASAGSLINCGIYIVNKAVLGYVPSDTKYDFSCDLFGQLVQQRQLAAYIHDGYWCDIGDMQSYYRSNFDMKSGGFFERAYNHHNARMQSFRSKSNIISAYSTCVGQVHNSIIGHNCRIASGSNLENVIVLDDTTIKGDYKNAIIGEGFVVKIEKSSFETPNLHEFTHFYNNF